MTDKIEKWRAEYQALMLAYENTHGHINDRGFIGYLLAKQSQPVVKLPAPYAQIEIDVDTGIRVVETPSHKTVAVFTAYQFRNALKEVGIKYEQ